MDWFDLSVPERLNQLTTAELVAQSGRVDCLSAFAASGGDLDDPDAFNTWMVSEAGTAKRVVARSIHTAAAYAPVPSLCAEALAELSELIKFGAGMHQADDDSVVWTLRGRYDVRAYVVIMLVSQLFERLTPTSGKQAGALPKLAGLSNEDQAFLKGYHDARDSYEHWDERLGLEQGADDGRQRDRLVKAVDERTISIGRSSTNDGSLRLAYSGDEGVVVDLTQSASQRIASVVSTAEVNIRAGTSNGVTAFLRNNPTARWLATEFGGMVRPHPFARPKA